jgi:hypothetical protein
MQRQLTPGYLWWALIMFVVWSYGSRSAPATELITHTLEVTLDPPAARLTVRDTVTLPPTLLTRHPQGMPFLLHHQLVPQVESGPYTLEALSGTPDLSRYGLSPPAVPLREYRLRPTAGTWPAPARPVLRYSGSSDLVDTANVVLSGASWWVPTFGTQLLTFTMTVQLPAGWEAISQGQRTRHDEQEGQRLVRWESPQPTDEIYLIAGRFMEYAQPAASVQTYAFLRQPDAVLAATYLEATAHYLGLYSRLLGPYPYSKFALVEHVLETGYGMPSFTLLGPHVLRLPFILRSSYPHEILHNWWGNGVFVEASRGNWAEGLTAYLADHLLQEAQGQGAKYRRETLQRYRNYVQTTQDFPLTAFQTRHTSAAQAVGYGKALMLWHMLRLELGDALFLQGLQQFYATYRFQRATFDDLIQTFMAVSGRALQPFFTQWLERPGAPSLTLQVTPLGQNLGRIELQQGHEALPYLLTVPVALTYAGDTSARMQYVLLNTRAASFDITDFAALQRVDVDPACDLFRRLDRREMPPALGQLFGADRVLLVLPLDAADGIPATAWRNFAAVWQRSNPAIALVREDALTTLPRDSAVWVLGANNRWRQSLAASLAAYGAGVQETVISFSTTQVPRADQSFVFVVSHSDNPEFAIGWIGAAHADALQGLARKLPHYGTYSYLAFAGSAPVNTVQGQWPTRNSPLVWIAPGAPTASTGTLPPRLPLDPFALPGTAASSPLASPKERPQK